MIVRKRKQTLGSVCKPVYTGVHGKSRRTDQRTMGKNRTVSPTAETTDWTTGSRPSPDAEWHSVDLANRSSLARPTRALREMDKRLQSFSTLAEEGNLEARLGRTANLGRPTERTELGAPFRGWDDNSCSPTCGWGKKSTPAAEALGRSRGGFGTKLHVRAEGNGRLLTFVLTPGQQHDITMAETLLERGAVLRKSVGRVRQYPKRLVADKGYSSRKFRAYLRKHHIAVTIPHKDNERHKGVFDKTVYRSRNRVERLFARLKQFRRVATRYEKRGVNSAAMVTIASIFLWSQFAYTP